jgi:putative transposase
MDEPRLRVTRRRLPHWTLSGAVYFVTFHLARGSLSQTERRLVLEHIRSGDPHFYDLAAVSVMPDHVHAILKPVEGMTPERMMKGIKGVSARRLNRLRGTRGRVWQEESWDRILRSVEEYEEKLQYMFDNAVKVGLVEDAGQYDGWWFNPDFT